MADEKKKKGKLLMRRRIGEKPNEQVFEIRSEPFVTGAEMVSYFIDDVRVDAEVFRLAIQLDQMASLDGIIRNGITTWKGEI